MKFGVDMVSPGGILSDRASSFISPDSRPKGEMHLAEKESYRIYSKKCGVQGLFEGGAY